MERFIKGDYAIALDSFDFKKGSLNKPSNIRPNRLFTAERRLLSVSLEVLNRKCLKRLWTNSARL